MSVPGNGVQSWQHAHFTLRHLLNYCSPISIHELQDFMGAGSPLTKDIQEAIEYYIIRNLLIYRLRKFYGDAQSWKDGGTGTISEKSMLHFTLIRKNYLRDLHTAGSSLYKRIYIYINIYTYIHIFITVRTYIHTHKLLLHIHMRLLIAYANRFCENTWSAGSSQRQLSIRNRAIWRMTIWTKYTKQREREGGGGNCMTVRRKEIRDENTKCLPVQFQGAFSASRYNTKIIL